MKKDLIWIDLGLISYEDAFVIQEQLHKKCVTKTCPDTLLFQENYPVITLGRGTHEQNLLLTPAELLDQGIALTAVSRGGDISYHGNGQFIVSPILHFDQYVKGAHQYVRCLEQVVINLLAHYQLKGKRIKGRSGVWVVEPETGEEKKVSALGIAVSHGVTLHGISINVNPNLEHFKAIIPCGIADKGVTSMEACGCPPISLPDLRDQFILAFDEMFGSNTTKRTIDEIVSHKR
ncbi:lipoyl(octanoyl) transferase LipB [Acetobacterium wieringae]|uniref:lipoyl(octanoyl) transferase LipB n=1 Tax=Acetobacterium wieringae TaxID=52694 RepID=UPI002B21C72E|nr:lipoyl(octanoyl) transferase LipB [Acetobacterium wieringae]MEA4804479.1 lipoyl(octanoyl) transferase LipB [Acetobacterium wieringae]